MSAEDNVDLSNRLVLALKAENRIVEISRVFAALPTDIRKIDFSLDLLKAYKLLPKFLKDEKCNEKAADLRSEGNQLFVKKKDEDALRTYTYSVAKAEPASEALGLAFANRSAVLFKVKLFKECLEDIERAFLNKYPPHLRGKLVERQKVAEELKSQQVHQPYHQPIPKIPQESLNDVIECASNAIQIKTDPEVGRHIIATRDIDVGEIIAVEKAAFTLLTGKVWCHCHHCLTLCYNLIPCESCTQVMFCSDKCRINAKKYHDYECPILKTVDSLDYSACRLIPLRIAILMKEKYNEIENYVGNERIYKSGRYREIHNLVTNQELRNTANLFERANCVAIYYHLIENHTDFFKNCDANTEQVFKSLVLRHLQTMSSNFHGMDDLEWNPATKAYENITVGSGAFSFLSLFNHSCAPNIQRVTYGTSIVLRTTEGVRRGEQLFENYGYLFATHPRSQRQAALKRQYFFDCRCRACVNNWGVYDSLPRTGTNALMQNYDKLAIADLKAAAEAEPAVKMAIKRLQNVRTPSKDYCEIQELYKQCHCIFGNIRRKLTSV